MKITFGFLMIYAAYEFMDGQIKLQ